MHPRKVLRDAVRAALLGQTAAGARVFSTRVLAYRDVDLPAISIYTIDEVVDLERSRTTAPRELTREVKLEIAGWVAPGPLVDDEMDELAEQIEAAMDADVYLGGAAGDCILDTTTLAIREDGKRLAGLVTLTYAATLRTLSPAPPSTLDDLLRVDARHKLAGSTPTTDVAEDLVTVRSA